MKKTNSGMAYIRSYYNVPAKRGARIKFTGDSLGKFIMGPFYSGKIGTIVAARGGYLRVRFDGDDRILTLHPTWEVKYL